MSSLTKKGQVTIPKEIREYLGLKPKDKIEFEIKEKEVRIKPIPNLEANFGKIKPKKRPENFRKIRRLFEKKVGKEIPKET